LANKKLNIMNPIALKMLTGSRGKYLGIVMGPDFRFVKHDPATGALSSSALVD